MKKEIKISHCAEQAVKIQPVSIVLIFAFVFMAFCLNAQTPGGSTTTTSTTSTPTVTATSSSGVLNPSFGETFYIKENARNRKATPYTYERESDIMWSKRVWRTIDLREKFNHALYFPETEINDRKSLFDVIKKGIMSGEITAFDNPVFDDEFRMPMNRSQYMSMFQWIDSTNYVDDPYNPDGPQILAPIPYELTSKDVKQYWIKEDWFFDRARSVMDVRILGLCPLQEKLDPTTQEIIGYKPLFWVYFPQCRPLFARSEVFNTKNDAQRNTFDDVFGKRQFQSFVRKESNVYDRPINAYTTGLDALLEADRIKDDISKMEHDVWHL